jgi:hypothetical protein
MHDGVCEWQRAPVRCSSRNCSRFLGSAAYHFTCMSLMSNCIIIVCANLCQPTKYIIYGVIFYFPPQSPPPLPLDSLGEEG